MMTSVPAALTVAPLRHVAVLSYVLALREGGSLPGLMEADDLGTYVVKFRGAGQGPRALVAEVVVGELARALGLPVPELVTVDLDPAFARSEPDEEVQDLLAASRGLNLGLDYLPGALDLDPASDTVDDTFAASVVWLDALTLNVDRSWRNPNLLLWGGRPWLIDHGAALYVHHDWSRATDAATRAYPGIEEHALLARAGSVTDAHERLSPQVTDDLLTTITDTVPECLARWRTRTASGRRTSTCSARGSRTPTPGCRQWSVPVPHTYEWAVLRVVPRVERAEFVNAGVVVYCRAQDFLAALVHLDLDRLAALDPRWTSPRSSDTWSPYVRSARGSRRPAPTGPGLPASASAGSSPPAAPWCSRPGCTPG